MKRSENQLKTEEISIITAMLERKDFDIDEIVSYFSTSTRRIKSNVILDIKDGKNYNGYETATQCKVDCFLQNKSELFPEKELSRLEQALLFKSRNAMTASFRNLANNLAFSMEISIISSVIAWTTLYHAIYENEGNNYMYRDQHKNLKFNNLNKYMKNIKNKELRDKLEELRINRNEIEHGIHEKIDDDIKKILIDTLVVFNKKIKCKFGEKFGLENFDPFVPIFQSFISDRKNFLHKYPESDDLQNEFKSLHTAFSLTKWQSHLDIFRKFPKKIFDIIWKFVKK